MNYFQVQAGFVYLSPGDLVSLFGRHLSRRENRLEATNFDAVFRVKDRIALKQGEPFGLQGTPPRAFEHDVVVMSQEDWDAAKADADRQTEQQALERAQADVAAAEHQLHILRQHEQNAKNRLAAIQDRLKLAEKSHNDAIRAQSRQQRNKTAADAKAEVSAKKATSKKQTRSKATKKTKSTSKTSKSAKK